MYLALLVFLADILPSAFPLLPFRATVIFLFTPPSLSLLLSLPLTSSPSLQPSPGPSPLCASPARIKLMIKQVKQKKKKSDFV